MRAAIPAALAVQNESFETQASHELNPDAANQDVDSAHRKHA